MPVAPSSRVVLYGATGFTGELTAREMVRRGMRPVIAGRARKRLEKLAAELGGLEVAVADVSEPRTVKALVGEGDVLVTTVGPFARWGEPALMAALTKRAHYLDATGESTFIRRVFELAGPQARREGVALLTAMGYDWVPGNLAAALALDEAGEHARRVRIAYFFDSSGGGNGVARSLSGGTRATAAGAMLDSGFAFRDGRLVDERPARRVSSFETHDGRRERAVSVASSEHFTLPRLAPQLREVDAYLGWFGAASRPLQAVTAGGDLIARIPGTKNAIGAVARRFVKGSTGGPSPAARARVRSLVIAEALDCDGSELTRVRLEGPNGYDLTAALLAWGAERAAKGGLRGEGALGPVEAFGLDELSAGATELGLTRTY
jgi:short subunit dehydrogenase-like uncharacterized protein